ncbi:MAG: DUF4922 domain-containing protein [Proteiniphilum sp.]|jgi:hypothetical protein|uniref:DUF4922 domain-containing protein n=1 Tax=Proteiniphilum sp. TaxID=1926877 RepID=UPI002B1EF4D2|nr:DUF4922 domain-containing protein [Proteiniphilum sp.]MEA5130079.1 DUF4922 domain-containing protein [Proteiniphilum sp.]
MDLQTKISHLFSVQQADWEQLRNGILQMDKLQEKEFTWGGDYRVRLQFNPARIISTAAAINQKAIEERPCFLCEVNRPAQQKGIPFMDKYIILCNPFPILSNHITIPLHSHVPQRIRKKMDDMLTLAEQLPDYLIFYNGPKCGASAPDHFHLQAGLKLPLLMQGDNELRSCLQIESEDKNEAQGLFEDVYQYLHHLQPEEVEPMMNVIAFTEDNKYKLHIFPRKAHRPGHYYEKGEKQLLISPGALDMAGLMICVREEDFEKISKHDIEDIYSQVSMPVI